MKENTDMSNADSKLRFFVYFAVLAMGVWKVVHGRDICDSVSIVEVVADMKSRTQDHNHHIN